MELLIESNRKQQSEYLKRLLSCVKTLSAHVSDFSRLSHYQYRFSDYQNTIVRLSRVLKRNVDTFTFVAIGAMVKMIHFTPYGKPS